MSDKNAPVNWLTALGVAAGMSAVFALMWNDWFFGIAIGVMLGIVAGYSITPRRRA